MLNNDHLSNNEIQMGNYCSMIFAVERKLLERLQTGKTQGQEKRGILIVNTLYRGIINSNWKVRR